MQNYEEIWKDIPNYEGLYQVSNLGRIKSLKRKVRSKGGSFKIVKERFLRSWMNRGYSQVDLSKNNKTKAFSVHRIVMIAFIGESELDVNHKNGIKTDNRLENLEYCTKSENMLHAYKKGLQKPLLGEKHGSSKITEGQAKAIKYGHKGMLQKDIAEIYGIGKSTVCQIRSGKLWPHI